MLSIGLAAGIFKPLISGTVRAVTDKTNKTLGFGIFYWMVNVGASFGPIVAGKLRAISWNYAFMAAAIGIGIMLLITIIFYKEPERENEGVTLTKKLQDMVTALSDIKFTTFLVLLGLFFWIPFWAFFNLMAIFIDTNLDTAQLYLNLQSVLGTAFTNIFSTVDDDGVHRVLGETISHTGYIIVLFQVFVSKYAERYSAIGTFLAGLFVVSVGFVVVGIAKITAPAWVLFGIFLFAIGEMMSSPRIQEYITWIAPKEKAGLYMGSNFLAVGLGAFSGLIYTPLYGHFGDMGHPEYVWYVLAVHTIVGIIAIFTFTRTAGEFKELEA